MAASNATDVAIARCIDIEAIEQLKVRYCCLVDEGWAEIPLWRPD